MTATEDYIRILTQIKSGELSLLRTHAGQGLDESVDGFDLFTGLWWPLREKNARAPRRSVAWLVAKVYAATPLQHSAGETLARQLRRFEPSGEQDQMKFRRRFDDLLRHPLDDIEQPLRWAVDILSHGSGRLDWVKLTDDLSIWERESTRLRWAEEFLGIDERKTSC